MNSLVRSGYAYWDETNDRLAWEDSNDGWFCVKQRAYDSGRVSWELLDAVVLDEALTRLDDGVCDDAVRAAVTLRLHGWDEGEIGALIGPRSSRGRTGAQLVDEGVRVLSRLVRES